MTDTFYVILNPMSDKGMAGQREAEIRAAFDLLGLDFELAFTRKVGHATRLARAAAATGRYKAVVAAGGDGTVNEVVNGLLGFHTPLSVLPIGTGNDFIKMLSPEPLSIPQAAQHLRDGRLRPVDLGMVNGRAFINGFGIGFDAHVAVEAAKLRRFRGFTVYMVALLKTLARFRAPELTISYEGQSFTRRMFMLTIANGRCHGGGFYITPSARIDDGLLELCLIERLRLDQVARHLPKVIKGTHTKLSVVTMASAREISVRSATPQPVHVDGEILPTAIQQLKISLQPGAVRVLF